MDHQMCKGCGEERDIEEFTWKNRARQIRQSRCRFCTMKKSADHYKNNKSTYVLKAKDRNDRIFKENRCLLDTYLQAHPCVDCGCSDIRVLDFDHIRGIKTDNISSMLKRKCAWSTIEAEIAKCEVRCGNCHRIKTIERGRHWRLLQGDAQRATLPQGDLHAEGAALALFGFDEDAATVAFDDVFGDGEAQAQAEFGR